VASTIKTKALAFNQHLLSGFMAFAGLSHLSSYFCSRSTNTVTAYFTEWLCSSFLCVLVGLMEWVDTLAVHIFQIDMAWTRSGGDLGMLFYGSIFDDMAKEIFLLW
jgi:hypothetical protein